jgi:hypothetical protein
MLVFSEGPGPIQCGRPLPKTFGLFKISKKKKKKILRAAFTCGKSERITCRSQLGVKSGSIRVGGGGWEL